MNKQNLAYVRVSKDTSDAERQRVAIVDAARNLGDDIDIWLEDVDGRNPRDLAHKRQNFQRMLRLVESGTVSRVYIESQERFGFRDDIEFKYFLHLFRQKGVRLISVTDGDLSRDDAATTFGTTAKSFASRQDQLKIGRTITQQKVLEARKGIYQGGYPPYGCDVVCFDPAGVEKWRVIFDGHFKRCRIWLDGRSERFDGKDNFPSKDKQDTLRVRPSIVLERLNTVLTIFSLYVDADLYERSIADRLRQSSIDPIYDGGWEKMRIKGILKNPVYIGFPAWNKQGSSRFYEYVAGETREVSSDVRLNKHGHPISGRKRCAEDIVKPAEIQFDPIVPVELWAKAQEKLERGRRPGKRRHSSTSALWLSGILYCKRCGKPMRCSMAKGTQRLEPNYFCATYGKYGRNNPSGCRCHRVKADVIHSIIESYLKELGITSLSLLSKPLDIMQITCDLYEDGVEEAENLNDLAKSLDKAVGGISAHELHEAMAEYDWSNEDTMEEVRRLCRFLDQRGSDAGQRLAVLNSEHERKAVAYLELPIRAREKAKREIERLEAEIAELEAAGGSGFLRRFDRITQRLEEIDKQVKKTKQLTNSGENDGKASIVASIVSRVDLQFRYTRKDGKPTKKSFLDGLDIVPHCFTDEISPGPD